MTTISRKKKMDFFLWQLTQPRKEGGLFYITEWGTLPLTREELDSSGAKFYKNGRYKNSEGVLLHEFLTLYVKDMTSGIDLNCSY